MEIRRAIPEDADWVLSELKKFSNFLEMKRSPYGDEEVCRASLLSFIENQLLLLAVNNVSEIETKLGFIGGFLTPHIFNPKLRVLCEVFWWVAEEHRGTRAGAMLLGAFLEYGETHADMITFSLEAKSPVNENTLLKRGFVFQEKNYIKEIV